MGFIVRSFLGISALLAISCAQPQSEVAVGELSVKVSSEAAFVQAADFPGRLESTIDASLGYWGGTWDDLRGVTLSIVDDTHVVCNGKSSALGCYDGDIRITTQDPGLGTLSCVEQTVLVHEIGHAVIGDFDHNDPRWMQMETVSDALAGRPGYAASGETACPIYVSIWRHPLGTP